MSGYGRRRTRAAQLAEADRYADYVSYLCRVQPREPRIFAVRHEEPTVAELMRSAEHARRLA